MKLKIPQYAKIEAKKALELRAKLPKYKKFGITKLEAKRLGIASGVERAKQIVRDKYMPLKDVKRVCAFKRFIPAKTMKEKGAVALWGGEKFIRKSCKFVNNMKGGSRK